MPLKWISVCGASYGGPTLKSDGIQALASRPATPHAVGASRGERAVSDHWIGKRRGNAPEVETTMTERPERFRPKQCPLYTPGHSMHWIQARLTWKEPKPHQPGRIRDIDEFGFWFETDTGATRYLNHETARMAHLLERHGPAATLVGYGVLQLSSVDDGSPMFCVKEDDGEPLGPCIAPVLPPLPADATPEQIARRLISTLSTHGGTSITLI